MRLFFGILFTWIFLDIPECLETVGPWHPQQDVHQDRLPLLHGEEGAGHHLDQVLLPVHKGKQVDKYTSIYTRPCTFVINPSLFLTLKIFLLLKWQFFSFFLWKTTRNLSISICLSIHLSIYLSSATASTSGKTGRQLCIYLSKYLSLSVYISIYLSINIDLSIDNLSISGCSLWYHTTRQSFYLSFCLRTLMQLVHSIRWMLCFIFLCEKNSSLMKMNKSKYDKMMC